MNRRKFFKFGAAGLLMAGGLGWLGKHFAQVDVIAGKSVVQPQHMSMLRAIAAGLLQPALPATGRTEAIEKAANAFVDASKTLAASAQAELGQLLNILENPVGRRLIADLGTSWEEATSAQVQAFLISFRDHPIPALQPGYHALHDLMMAGWYGLPEQWAEMGYPGPPFQVS
ncbi:hypothetical protein [Limnobacter parvus]|uniref:Gluconate 2-dehydrogenase subunit 3 family protein n=1 Tax=Limnobacter parvus TaxID=2939690 RepID=A0ABT1XHB6_9BURK|nr:hypothetical protein [Limnobacter parvus]MCR2746678.1 hypothetical protein [Limnobacter parvus]